MRHWPDSNRLYDVSNGATPYLVNGDQRTGIPFVINNVKDQEYVRVWTSNPYDGEVLALDVAFPYSNYCHRAVVGDDEEWPFFRPELGRRLLDVLDACAELLAA